MAKRDHNTTGKAGRTTAANTPDATTADAFEERVVAFATQLGRIAGTVQAKAEGWLDRERLSEQIASVRDNATDLLKQMTGSPLKRSKKAPTTAARGPRKGRSGGVVDAPGKKHRKPVPSHSSDTLAKSQADKARMAKTLVKTNRLRGRG